ncbi:OmpA family protein [Salipiger sp. P9]|uniref:flagellar motor protein MotB n=1 Tax=Salipiger pentaromativorans TaxID=2943193 RepID=UPI002157441D|nr:flagellar motor protein MotB [Salipiger pentaromativorans]MCR8550576.1 OmpA family protein [Salipiger pentaromativorans]
MAGKNEQAIVIKRIEEDDGHGHHGGAWKVAYADFMTAMMAFFLLLWILAASDEEKLRGLADYFTPSLSESGGRGEGFLDGTVLAQDGVMSGTDGPATPVQLPSFGQENPLAVFDSRLRDESPKAVVEYDTRPEGERDTTTVNEEGQDGIEAAQAAAEAERAQQQWEEAQTRLEDQILEQVISNPELQALSENLRFDRTENGLEIQIVDKTGSSMFATGSARIADKTRELLRIIGEAVAELPNDLTISGHTDSVPYSGSGTYSNWELSADRANATRRVLVENGVSAARITGISGLADTAPLDPATPDAPENRRISVTVLYPDSARPHP